MGVYRYSERSAPVKIENSGRKQEIRKGEVIYHIQQRETNDPIHSNMQRNHEKQSAEQKPFRWISNYNGV